MRKFIITITAMAALAAPGIATAGVLNNPAAPTGYPAPSTHGFDLSFVLAATSAGGLAQGPGVPNAIAGCYSSVQVAQIADRTYARTGVLVPCDLP